MRLGVPCSAFRWLIVANALHAVAYPGFGNFPDALMVGTIIAWVGLIATRGLTQLPHGARPPDAHSIGLDCQKSPVLAATVFRGEVTSSRSARPSPKIDEEPTFFSQ